MKRKVIISFEIDVDNTTYRNKFASNRIDEVALFNTIQRQVERFKYTDLESINGTKIKDLPGHTVGRISTKIKN